MPADEFRSALSETECLKTTLSRLSEERNTLGSLLVGFGKNGMFVDVEIVSCSSGVKYRVSSDYLASYLSREHVILPFLCITTSCGKAEPHPLCKRSFSSQRSIKVNRTFSHQLF